MNTVIAAGVLGILGTVVGFGGNYFLALWQKNAKEKERMINLYADWVSAINIAFLSYVQGNHPGSSQFVLR